MKPAVLYTPYATYSKEKTGYIITFEQFEEGNLPSEYRNCTASGDESEHYSTLSPFISEAKMDEISSGDNMMLKL